MRTLSRVAFLMFAMLLYGTALAGSPHFIGPVNATLQHNGSLKVCFKEAGLGNQPVDYVVSADADATFRCATNSGNCPSAENKTSEGTVSAEQTLEPKKNGQVTACITLGPPTVTQFCPNGQNEIVTYVAYTNIVVQDTTNGVSGSTPQTVEAYPDSCKNQ